MTQDCESQIFSWIVFESSLIPIMSFPQLDKNMEAADDALFVHSLQAMFFFGYYGANGEVQAGW